MWSFELPEQQETELLQQERSLASCVPVRGCTSWPTMLFSLPFAADTFGSSLTLVLRKPCLTAKSPTLPTRWLRERPEVKQVFHAGFEDNPQRELFLKQMRNSSGLISFEPVDQDVDRLRAFTEALRLYRLGVSWGGHESLCVPLEYHPMDWPEKRWLVRLYSGLEHEDDLIADLDQAFKVAR